MQAEGPSSPVDMAETVRRHRDWLYLSGDLLDDFCPDGLVAIMAPVMSAAIRGQTTRIDIILWVILIPGWATSWMASNTARRCPLD
jgi:hypothetical protein